MKSPISSKWTCFEVALEFLVKLAEPYTSESPLIVLSSKNSSFFESGSPLQTRNPSIRVKFSTKANFFGGFCCHPQRSRYFF